MSALSSTSTHHEARDLPSFIGETALPILIGSLSGAGCGVLIWTFAAVRLGLTGWLR